MVKYNLRSSLDRCSPNGMDSLLRDGKILVSEGQSIGKTGYFANHSLAKPVVFVKIIVPNQLFSNLSGSKP